MKNFSKYTITAALPYVNGNKHIGHLAGAYLPADIYARYKRNINCDVAFICGSDEMGTAITIQALKENLSPKELVDKYHNISKYCFEKLGISFDIYYRTTEELHKSTVQEFFLNLYDKGMFEKRDVEQYFDEENKIFLADRYIQGTCPNCMSDKAYGDQCEKCGKSLDPTDLLDPFSTISGKKPILKKSTNLFLRLDLYEDFLKEWILIEKKNIWKANTYGQSKSWIDSGIQARSMTRDGDWGVKVPLDDFKNNILYVWFDAPIGYISATKEWAKQNNKNWKDYWQNKDTKLIHFVGKDNIVFHCIIFPIMLKMHGDYIMPTDVPANEFLNLEGQKMSTSRNWSLEMIEYIEAFPNKIDELRYCLTANMPENKDSDFSWNDFQLKVNSELVSILGNFVNRVFVLLEKYFDSVIPETNQCTDLNKYLVNQTEKISSFIEKYSFREAMFEVMNIARYGNKLLTEKEPWKLYKSDKEKTAIVLYDCLEIIVNLSIIIEPFLPFSSIKLKEKLNINKVLNWANIGNNNLLERGSKIQKPFYLFDQILDSEIEEQITKLKNKNPVNNINNNLEVEDQKELVEFNDFAKLDLRIGTILEAKNVEKSNKLFEFLVDLGFEKRTILSGVAKHFELNEMIGKQVVVVANLFPKKIMGIESKGMILFAQEADKLFNLTASAKINNGSTIS